MPKGYDPRYVMKQVSITRAIDRIAERHAELGAYLHGTIKTGGDCRYEEHEPQKWLV